MIVASAPALLPAGAASSFAISFAAFAAFLVLWGLRYGYVNTLGALLRAIARATEDIWIIGGKLADALLWVDNYVESRIADAALAMEQTAGKFWHAGAWLVRLMADSLIDFANDTYNAIENVIDIVIPKQVKGATRPVDRRLDAVNKRTSAAERAEAQRRARGIDRLRRDLTLERLARQAGIDAIITRVLGRVRAGEAVLGRAIADVRGYTLRGLRAATRRISRAEQLALAGVAAVAILSRVFPYWRCTNVRGFNRALCRMGVDDLAGLLGLLAGTALLALALDPRLLAKAAVVVTDGLENIIRETAIR